MDNFVKFICDLAPEGETALLVKQVPKKRGGVVQRYDDGTIKTTYPSFLPDDATIKPGDSWYGNTGCYVLDRLTPGKPSAAIPNCDFVLVMILDDVGTKSKTPMLDPTWIMESSPGNFQWGYAFDPEQQPTKGEYSAAIKAMADAGYTDPGALNPVRNFRVPGSVNIKEGNDSFAARLVELHPERLVTLQEILDVHSVVAGEPDSFAPKPIQLDDDGSDTVLRWLSDHDVVLSNVRSSGWVDVVCPNHEQHTDGSVSAGYRPSDRVFKCLHGHCVDLDSKAFLTWVKDNGGPEAIPGLREELLAAVHNKTLDKLRPTETFPDAGAEIIAEVKHRQLGRIQRAEWFNNFSYVLSDDSYFDLKHRREISRANFNALFRHVSCKSIHTDRRVEASVCYDESRDAAGADVLMGVTFAPGDGVVLERHGELFGNRWLNSRPEVDLSRPVLDSEVQVWLDHAAVLVPDEDERAHIFNVMACKVQKPTVKINHAVLHGGDEGCGKDTLWAPFIWAVAGPNNRNRTIVDNEGLHSQWGYNLEAEIVILNELKEPEAAQRRALANRLKPIIAAPPDTISINRKGLHPYDMVNRVLVLAFTNEPVPISLPTQDRRWFALWSRAPKMQEHAATAIWHWYKKGGGFEKIAAWLWQRDVSRFNPAAPPIATDYKLSLVEQSRSMVESRLIEMILLREGPFRHGLIGGPFHALMTELVNFIDKPVYLNTLLHALKEAGWTDLGRIGSKELPTKKHLWCAPGFDKGRTKTEMRQMVEG